VTLQTMTSSPGINYHKRKVYGERAVYVKGDVAWCAHRLELCAFVLECVCRVPKFLFAQLDRVSVATSCVPGCAKTLHLGVIVVCVCWGIIENQLQGVRHVLGGVCRWNCMQHGWVDATDGCFWTWWQSISGTCCGRRLTEKRCSLEGCDNAYTVLSRCAFFLKVVVDAVEIL